MPPITFPPTPAPSTDITGKEDAGLRSMDPSFALPPSALDTTSSLSSSSSASSSSADDYTHDPSFAVSHTPPQESLSNRSSSKRKPSLGQLPNQHIQRPLPPPPTRPRKIIQMKPKTQSSKQEDKKASTSSSKAPVESATASKKKQASGSTAGRKIARKTAHSIIERRRREKMNEEFNLLKSMVPACTGQEMHKLAILQVCAWRTLTAVPRPLTCTQASIQYMQYLQKCVNDIQFGHPAPLNTFSPSLRTADMLSDGDSDEEMDDAEEASSSIMPTLPSPSGSITIMSPTVAGRPTYDSGHPRSTLPSPTFQSTYGNAQPSNLPQHLPLPASHFSPVLLAQTRHADEEASAALLMLNANDRRNTVTSQLSNSCGIEARHGSTSRGMSVKDLLRN